MFDLMEKMYIEFSKRFDNIENDIGILKTGMSTLKEDVTKINTKIEHELMPKTTILFDGHRQHSEQLDRIEKEVSKHEEIILRRIK